MQYSLHFGRWHDGMRFLWQIFSNFVNSYDDDAKVYQNDKHKWKYNRITHFKESLDEILGKQTKRVPNDVLFEIKMI